MSNGSGSESSSSLGSYHAENAALKLNDLNTVLQRHPISYVLHQSDYAKAEQLTEKIAATYGLTIQRAFSIVLLHIYLKIKNIPEFVENAIYQLRGLLLDPTNRDVPAKDLIERVFHDYQKIEHENYPDEAALLTKLVRYLNAIVAESSYPVDGNEKYVPAMDKEKYEKAADFYEKRQGMRVTYQGMRLKAHAAAESNPSLIDPLERTKELSAGEKQNLKQIYGPKRGALIIALLEYRNNRIQHHLKTKDRFTFGGVFSPGKMNLSGQVNIRFTEDLIKFLILLPAVPLGEIISKITQPDAEDPVDIKHFFALELAGGIPKSLAEILKPYVNSAEKKSVEVDLEYIQQLFLSNTLPNNANCADIFYITRFLMQQQKEHTPS